MKTTRTLSIHRTGTMPVELPKITKLDIKQSLRYQNNNMNNKNITFINNKESNHAIQTNNNNNKSNSNRSSFIRMPTSRTKHTHSFILSKSPFTSRLQQQSISEQQYPYTETPGIQKQQHRLKQLLKQFNQETVEILQKYIIDKPIKRQYIKKKPQLQQLQHIRQRQSQNSMTMILLMKKQIEKLQSRCEDLKYTSKEQIEQKIKQLREQKYKLIQQNKQISREITINGLQIIKGRQSQVKELDYQFGVICLKRDKLKREEERVDEEMRELQQKTADLNYQMEQLEETESYSLKLYEQKERQKSQNRLYEEYISKKRHFDHLKVMTQSINYQMKHKYLQLLKALDQNGGTNQELQNRNYEVVEKIDSAIVYIEELEAKYQQVVVSKSNNNKNKTSSTKAQIVVVNNNDNNIDGIHNKSVDNSNTNNSNDKNKNQPISLLNTQQAQDQAI